MESVSKQFAEFLEDNNIGTVGDDIFVGFSPEQNQGTNKSDSIAIYETGGMDGDLYVPRFYPTLQVVVRNNDYSDAEAKIKAIHDLVEAKLAFSLVSGGYYVEQAKVMGHWSHLGRDVNDVDRFTMNVQLVIKRDDLTTNY